MSWLLVVGMLIVSPVCAEYLTGYDDTTGNPTALLGGLLILGPLYGAPAVLIRETARRFDIRWPGVLAMAAGAGIVQAGVIDQSLFSLSYRAIPYWESMIEPTFIAPLGLAAANALTFIVGHMVWSFCIPIAVMESLHPASSRRPWLRWPGMTVMAVLYLAAAGLILDSHVTTEKDHASIGQIAGSLLVAMALLIFAFTVGRHRSTPRDRWVPHPWCFTAAGFAATFGFEPGTWTSVAAAVAVAAALAVLVGYFARSRRWTGRHVVALAAGGLLSQAVVGFFAAPLGEVAPAAKYGHNVFFLLAMTGLIIWAWRRGRPSASSSQTAAAGSPHPC